jgi:crotonobetainyl-CoA:carnitine CoA-transferase CaiB-like acyl-CoA transferase
MEAHIGAYDKTGYIVGREGAGHSGSVVNNLFLTSDGQYVHIQGSQTNSFRRLCLAMGRPDILDDARFNTRLERAKNGDEMDGIVADWVAARDFETVEKELSAEDVVFTRIYTMADIFKDPHFKARGMIPEIADEEIGTVAMAAPVPRLTRTPGTINKSGGRVGRDTFEVLHDLFGLSAVEIEQLERDRIISTKPPVAVKRGGESS